jgi:hypothetical protein
MRARGFRWLSAASLSLVLLSTGGPTEGGGWRTQETVYIEPTASIWALPTSYVVPGAAVLPTTAVLPTVYATAYRTESYVASPTTILRPTVYVPTTTILRERVVRRPLFGRRWSYVYPTTTYVPTSYVSTSYVPTVFLNDLPVIYDSPLVESSVVYPTIETVAAPCDEGVSIARATPRVTDRPVTSSAPKTGAGARGSIRSQPTEPPVSSAVEPSFEDEETAPAATRKPSPAPATSRPNANRPSSSPPPAPAAPKSATPKEQTDETTLTPSEPASQPEAIQPRNSAVVPAPVTPAPTPAAPETEPTPAPTPTFPVAPETGGLDVEPAAPTAPDGDEVIPEADEFRRESRKPVLGTQTVSPRNLLKGRVRSSKGGDAVEGVEIIVSSQTNAFKDRVVFSNEVGRFSVALPDGDWTVKVAMPSGRVYPVSQITVSNGHINDDLGRNVPSLIITR